MDSDYSSPLSKAVLTSLFAGIAATLLCIVYDIAFRNNTDFVMSEIINVSSLIFLINLAFLVIGFIYHLFLRMAKGEMIYIGFILLIFVVFSFMANNVHRSDVPLLNTEFHQLLVPIVVIMGLVASLGIPLLFHNKKFEEHVL
jgi:hypothetical protein